MFKNIFRRGPAPLPFETDVDTALDDHDLRAARERAVGGDWRAAADVIAAGTDWERRGHRIAILGAAAAAGDGDWLDAWLAAAPQDPTAATVSASALSRRAGNARGAAAAASTTAEQFRRFDELSQEAMVEARRAVALDVANPAACAILGGTMYARGDRAGFRQALAEGRRRDPFYFMLNTTAVDFLCAKWFGSHEQMFEAARTTAAAAPPGAGVTMLPLQAHLEYAMREFAWARFDHKTLRDSHAYFRRPEVQQEVDACVAKWRANGPPTHARALVCDNWLAIAYTLGDRRNECRAVFDRIGPYAAAHEWAYFFRMQKAGFEYNWRWAHRVKM